MKQYLNSEQTAKLIKLGFKKPKSISGYYQRGSYEYDAETNTKMVVYDDTQYPIYAYSIGELLEFVDEFEVIETYDKCVAVHNGTGIHFYDKEIIDALFELCVQLKEEGVI
jgi:hypothetical protein